MSKFKYQIDIGGQGGTSWLGTLSKLAMPGLLFHHETLTKDLFYSEIQPWIHYVPVDTDLSNLYERFRWAESHPQEAQKIAQQGQEYARLQLSADYLSKMYDEVYVQQVQSIVHAYRPTAVRKGNTESSLQSIIQEYASKGVFARHIATCDTKSCKFAKGGLK
jgi:hypothetical protein